jgi:hypothetical protein
MTKKMWISKYALSRGYCELLTGKVNSSEDYLWIDYVGLRIGIDAHETEQEANAAADAARVRKIASLRKQLARLEAMTFTAGGTGEVE